MLNKVKVLVYLPLRKPPLAFYLRPKAGHHEGGGTMGTELEIYFLETYSNSSENPTRPSEISYLWVLELPYRLCLLSSWFYTTLTYLVSQVSHLRQNKLALFCCCSGADLRDTSIEEPLPARHRAHLDPYLPPHVIQEHCYMRQSCK